MLPAAAASSAASMPAKSMLRLARRNRDRTSTLKPALVNSARWFSQLGSLIITFAFGAEFLQEVGTDLQATGTADSLHRGHPAGRDGFGAGAKHQVLDDRIVGGDAVDRQVAAGLGRFHHGLLRRLHALQQRQFAVLVVIDTDAQIDLCRIGVGRRIVRSDPGSGRGGPFQRR
jgi:hypothetical protein